MKQCKELGQKSLYNFSLSYKRSEMNLYVTELFYLIVKLYIVSKLMSYTSKLFSIDTHYFRVWIQSE